MIRCPNFVTWLSDSGKSTATFGRGFLAQYSAHAAFGNSITSTATTRSIDEAGGSRPDGHSWLVTYGLLNLTHRQGDEKPVALTPGTAYDVAIDLSLIAHRFKSGNRIRLAVSESLWPLVWPSPQVATLTLTLGASSLELPVRPQARDPLFPIPLNTSGEKPAPRRAQLKVQGPDGDGRYEITQDPPPYSYTIADTGTVLTGTLGPKETLTVKQGDNNSCVWQSERIGGFKRGDWHCSVYSSFRLTSTPTAFYIEETVRALDGDNLRARE